MREWLETLHIKFEDISHEDELWTVIILCQAGRVVITDHDFYYYRQQKDSHTCANTDRFIHHLIKELTLFSDKYPLEN